MTHGDTMNDKENADAVMLVLSTCPPDRAEELASMLVDSHLAACVNIIPSVTSFYHWQGSVQQDNESLMVIKCAAGSYARLEERLRRAHPYELPEIITVPRVGGLTEYLQWVRSSCHPTNPEQSK